MASPKLFLDWNDIDGQFHVNNRQGFAFGGPNYEPTEAIKHARIVTDDPIVIGENEYTNIKSVCVPEKPSDAIEDAELFISALAEISGMKVTKYYDDNMHFTGYGMELSEDDDFIKAEIATEEHENRLVSALGSYMEDD